MSPDQKGIETHHTLYQSGTPLVHNEPRSKGD